MYVTNLDGVRAAEAPAVPTHSRPELAFSSTVARSIIVDQRDTTFGSALIQRQVLERGCGDGQVDHLDLGNDVQGYYANFRCNADLVRTFMGAGALKFHFKLSGNNTVEFANGERATVSTGQMSVLLHPHSVRKLDCMPQSAVEHSLTIVCKPSLLVSTLGLDPDALPLPLRICALGRGDPYFLQTMPLTAVARKTLGDMLHSPHSGRFSHIHAAARALDLICIALDVLVGDERRPRTRLSAREQRTLEGIRSYLAERFMSPPSIPELARMAGMNRTKLTQGYRELFNETVLAYCLRLRMHHARQLLLEGESVGRVAAAVGYEHHSSFSQAFKAYFGSTPAGTRCLKVAGRP